MPGRSEDWLGKVPRDSEIPHSELKSLCRNGLGKPCPSAGSRMIELSPPTPPALDTEITTASGNVVASLELLGRIPLCPITKSKSRANTFNWWSHNPGAKGSEEASICPLCFYTERKALPLIKSRKQDCY